MRCYCCNRKLTDYECSLKSDETGIHVDTCVKCLAGLSIKVSGNSSLAIGNELDVDDVLDIPDDPWVFDVPDNKLTEDE